jgi:hypothetical protein
MAVNKCCVKHVRILEIETEETFLCGLLKILNVDTGDSYLVR